MKRDEFVFAYGSNLSIAQMTERCPSWQIVGRAELPGHELVFAGWSTRWEGAVATFVEAPRLRVRGVVFRMHKRDLDRLDGYEGGNYDRRRVVVRIGKRRLPCHTYQLVGFDSPGVPSPAYVAVLATAYRAWKFDRRHLVRAVRAADLEAV